MYHYLRAFILGSSWAVFVLFFLAVMKLTNKNYTYEFYTVVAPVYLGLMNVLSLYLAEKYNLTLRQRFLLIGILSPLIVIMIAKIGNVYNYTTTEWLGYYCYIILKHMFIFNVIVYYLTLWTN